MNIPLLLAQEEFQASPDPWAEQLFGLDPSMRFSLLVVAIGCLTGVIITVVCVVTSAMSQAQQRRIETELKREMLDRGMSADEVAKVIKASASEEPSGGLNWLRSPFCR